MSAIGTGKLNEEISCHPPLRADIADESSNHPQVSKASESRCAKKFFHAISLVVSRGGFSIDNLSYLQPSIFQYVQVEAAPVCRAWQIATNFSYRLTLQDFQRHLGKKAFDTLCLESGVTKKSTEKEAVFLIARRIHRTLQIPGGETVGLKPNNCTVWGLLRAKEFRREFNLLTCLCSPLFGPRGPTFNTSAECAKNEAERSVAVADAVDFLHTYKPVDDGNDLTFVITSFMGVSYLPPEIADHIPGFSSLRRIIIIANVWSGAGVEINRDLLPGQNFSTFVSFCLSFAAAASITPKTPDEFVAATDRWRKEQEAAVV